jgi:hypothetical protein
VWQSFLSISPHLSGETIATSQTCCHLSGKMLNSAAECADRARIVIGEFLNLVTWNVFSWNVLEMWSKHSLNVIQTCSRIALNVIGTCILRLGDTVCSLLKCAWNVIQTCSKNIWVALYCFILWLAHEFWNLVTQHVRSWNMLEMWSKRAWNVLEMWSKCAWNVIQTCSRIALNVIGKHEFWNWVTQYVRSWNVLEMWTKHAPELL